MEKDSTDWLTAIFVVFVAGCAWVGLLSVIDGMIELMREAYGWWRESRAKSARKGSSMTCPRCKREVGSISSKFVCTECQLADQIERSDRLEIVIHGIRRMAESGCTLAQIIDVCEAEFPEPLPRNGE